MARARRSTRDAIAVRSAHCGDSLYLHIGAGLGVEPYAHTVCDDLSLASVDRKPIAACFASDLYLDGRHYDRVGDEPRARLLRKC